jgi:hypothetical protein
LKQQGEGDVTSKAGILITLFLSAPHLFGQVPPAKGRPFGRLLVDTSIGDEKRLGFIPPNLAIGITLEKPVGNHIEFQTGVSYSPDNKFATHDGNNFAWTAKGILFPRWRVGFSARVGKTYLWTSQFSKQAWDNRIGLVIRNHMWGVPGRFSVDYVIPSGCVWAVKCLLPLDGIQSNRTQGPEFNQEFRTWTFGSASKYTLRVGEKIGMYHFCDQSNPLVQTRRICHVGGITGLTLRLELGSTENAAW